MTISATKTDQQAPSPPEHVAEPVGHFSAAPDQRADQLAPHPVEDRQDKVDGQCSGRAVEAVLPALEPVRDPVRPRAKDVEPEERRRGGNGDPRHDPGLGGGVEDEGRRFANPLDVAEQREEHQPRDDRARERHDDHRRWKSEPQRREQPGDQPASGADHHGLAQQGVDADGGIVLKRRDPDLRCVGREGAADDDDERPAVGHPGVVDPHIVGQRPQCLVEERRHDPGDGDEDDDGQELDDPERGRARDLLPVAGAPGRTEPDPPTPRQTNQRERPEHAGRQQQGGGTDHARDAQGRAVDARAHLRFAVGDVGDGDGPAAHARVDRRGHLGETRLDLPRGLTDRRTLFGPLLCPARQLGTQQLADFAVGHPGEQPVDHLGGEVFRDIDPLGGCRHATPHQRLCGRRGCRQELCQQQKHCAEAGQERHWRALFTVVARS